MRSLIMAFVTITSACLPALACDLVPPSREPTLAEKLGGVREIFGGTVVGYRTYGGVELMGLPPSECRDEYGYFIGLWEAESSPGCQLHFDVVEALFRVDVPIVGRHAVGDIATYEMHWGDGDCDQDFVVGQKWLIAGPYVIEELQAPIRDDEIVKLRKLAARPAFDMKQLYD